MEEATWVPTFISVFFFLTHPDVKNLCLPQLWAVPKALTTIPSYHSGWHPLKPQVKINLLSFSCFLMVVYRDRNHGSYRVSGTVASLTPSDCSVPSIPRHTRNTCLWRKGWKVKTVFTSWKNRGQKTAGQQYRCLGFTAHEWKMCLSWLKDVNVLG